MATLNHNRIMLDLNKVQYARFQYRNQFGDACSIKPPFPTSRSVKFNPFNTVFKSGLTMEEYAIKHNLLDIWTPEVYLQLQANHSLTYTGQRAVSIWKEWCARQFNKKGKKK